MTPARIAINGFGRVGRLALRAAWGRDDLHLVHVNELHGNAATEAQDRWAPAEPAPSVRFPRP